VDAQENPLLSAGGNQIFTPRSRISGISPHAHIHVDSIKNYGKSIDLRFWRQRLFNPKLTRIPSLFDAWPARIFVEEVFLGVG